MTWTVECERCKEKFEAQLELDCQRWSVTHRC